jgi:hypothetical protein
VTNIPETFYMTLFSSQSGLAVSSAIKNGRELNSDKPPPPFFWRGCTLCIVSPVKNAPDVENVCCDL